MREVLIRLFLAAAATLILVLASSTHGQNAVTRSVGFQQETEPQRPRPQQPGDAAMPPSNETQTQDIHSFTGHIAKDDGQIVLKDPVTKMTYRLDDASKAKQYVGKQVKVTGRLGLDSNTIYVKSIEPRP